MTELLFRDDAYLTTADCRIIGHTPEGGIIVDRSVFYPTGGGQPGDNGRITWGPEMKVRTPEPSPRWSLLQNPPDFSLVLGGPLFQLLRRAHLSDDALMMLRQRIVLIALLAWLPLLLMSAFTVIA